MALWGRAEGDIGVLQDQRLLLKEEKLTKHSRVHQMADLAVGHAAVAGVAHAHQPSHQALGDLGGEVAMPALQTEEMAAGRGQEAVQRQVF